MVAGPVDLQDVLFESAPLLILAGLALGGWAVWDLYRAIEHGVIGGEGGDVLESQDPRMFCAEICIRLGLLVLGPILVFKGLLGLVG